jgi:hypothetical protein
VFSVANARRKPVQRKVEIGAPNDRYEREADAVADRVASGRSAPTISRIPAGDLGGATRRQAEEEETQKLAVRRRAEEEEEAQALAVRRQAEEEEEPVQERSIQLHAQEDEEAAQTFAVQREGEEEGAPVQEVQRRGEAEEEPVQELAVQRQGEKDQEEEPVQELAAQRQAEEEEEPVQEVRCQEEEEEEAQRAPAGGGGSAGAGRSPAAGQSMGQTAARAIAGKGPGKPLDSGTRRTLESGMGADLSGVRVHDEARDREASRNLNARAFTHGDDVWLGPGESERDVRLMAHEATHVVQQGHSVQRTVQRLVQRAGALAPGVFEATNGARIDTNDKILKIPTMRLPNVANKRRGLTTPFDLGAEEERTNQLGIWKSKIAPHTNELVNDMLNDTNVVVHPDTGKKNWYLEVGSGGRLLAGSKRRIQSEVKRPNWTEDGSKIDYDVDHVIELQLGGPASDEKNFQLLDSETNRSSGSKIKGERDKVIDDAYTDVQKDNAEASIPSLGTVKSSYRHQVQAIASEVLPVKGSATAYLFEDVKAGDLMKPLRVMTKNEVEARPELQGNPSKLKIFLTSGAAKPIEIKWAVGKGQGTLRRKNFAGIQGFDATGISYDVGAGGTLTGRIGARLPAIEPADVSVPLEELTAPYTLQANTEAVEEQLRNLLQAPGASPIELLSVRLSESAFEAEGVLKPTMALAKQGLTIDLKIQGDTVTLSKTFSTDELQIPGPVELTESSLTLSIGNRGFEVGGALNFKIDKVGEGSVEGGFSQADGPFLKGSFEVDKELVDKGTVTLDYRKDTLTGEGELGIKTNKFKGVKSANGKLIINGADWSATGTVDLMIPAAEAATLTIGYDSNAGFEIAGSVEFGQGVPRLKSGRVDLKLAQGEAGGGFKLSGRGRAEFDVPGLDAAADVTYDDGLFTAEVTAGYEKGIASGELTVGVTNQPVGEGGAPPAGAGGGEGDDTLTPYGKGSVTLKFTPWLEATAGLELKPDGSLIVSGEVGLPDVVEVFPEKKIEKELFSIGLDIPIVGVAVAGQRIGIFVTIGGSLTAKASVGPGELREMRANVTYNPENEADTRVTGTARFVVPAEAGLRLGVNASLGAGIPIVSARVGLEIGGTLGIKGEATAGADIEWGPSTGVSFEAFVELSAEPVLKFDITGFALVEADLLLTTIELYRQDWELAAFEYGSGLRVGVRLPVKVQNSEFKDISIGDVEFIEPEVDVPSLLKGLVSQIA